MSQQKAKIDAQLQGQSSIARKIYEFVPIEEAWGEFQVIAAMKRVTGSVPDMRVARACLRDLAEAGLILRRHDQYRRITTQEKPLPKEIEMPSVKAKPAVQPAGQSPIEILGDIAAQIVALGRSVARQMEQIAGRVEEAALQIEQGHEANEANLEKLRQLQAILKSL